MFSRVPQILALALTRYALLHHESVHQRNLSLLLALHLLTTHEIRVYRQLREVLGLFRAGQPWKPHNCLSSPL